MPTFTVRPEFHAGSHSTATATLIRPAPPETSLAAKTQNEISASPPCQLYEKQLLKVWPLYKARISAASPLPAARHARGILTPRETPTQDENANTFFCVTPQPSVRWKDTYELIDDPASPRLHPSDVESLRSIPFGQSAKPGVSGGEGGVAVQRSAASPARDTRIPLRPVWAVVPFAQVRPSGSGRVPRSGYPFHPCKPADSGLWGRPQGGPPGPRGTPLSRAHR